MVGAEAAVAAAQGWEGLPRSLKLPHWDSALPELSSTRSEALGDEGIKRTVDPLQLGWLFDVDASGLISGKMYGNPKMRLESDMSIYRRYVYDRLLWLQKVTKSSILENNVLYIY